MHVVIETRMWLSCTEGFKIHRLSRIRVARMEGCMHAGFTPEGFTHGGFTCMKGSRMRVSRMEGCMHAGFTHEGSCMRVSRMEGSHA